MTAKKTMDHAAYQAALRTKTHEQLLYIIRDAAEAAAANPQGENAGFYMDEVHYAHAELRRRAQERRIPGRIIPIVGMGATVQFGNADRIACTITEVHKNGRRVVVREDNARPLFHGMTELQDYEYSPNPDGGTYDFTLRKNGRYVLAGEPAESGSTLSVGVRNKYYNFSY